MESFAGGGPDPLDLEALVDTARGRRRRHADPPNPRGGREEVFGLHGVCPDCGIGLERLDPRLFSFNSKQGACPGCGGLGESAGGRPCSKCGGSRLRPEALAVKIGGRSIWELVGRPVADLPPLLAAFVFEPHQQAVAEPILTEILLRLDLLNRLGLSYLTLGRGGNTLSGGEAQRVRLAAQIGSNLTGVSYILDEPTIGLHPRDSRTLIDALVHLKQRGNTILVVEHDEDTIRAADHIIDLGPGAGRSGGEIVAAGTLAELKKNPASVTGASFNGRQRAVTSRLRPYGGQPRLSVKGACAHNLKKRVPGSAPWAVWSA